MNSALAIQQIPTNEQTSKLANSFQIKPISLAVMPYANKKKHWKNNDNNNTHKESVRERARETAKAYALINVRSRHIAVCNSLSVVASSFFLRSSVLIFITFIIQSFALFACVCASADVCITWIRDARMDARAFCSLSRRHYTQAHHLAQRGSMKCSKQASNPKPSKKSQVKPSKSNTLT